MYAYLQNAAAGRPVYAPMKANQKASPMYQIVVGPWGHGQGIDQTIQLEWYDTWLKNEDTPLRHTHNPMHLYQQGTNTWINTADFPMVNKYTPYYLNASGVLSTAAPKSRGSDSLQFAPPQMSSLTYTTPAFKKGATLAGPISATITAASSSTNMDIITSLYDVAPTAPRRRSRRATWPGRSRRTTTRAPGATPTVSSPTRTRCSTRTAG